MSKTAEEIKQRRASDPEFAERTRIATRKYRAANLEKERERDREHKAKKRISDREAHNAYMREWNLKNRDRLNEEKRERRKNDPEYKSRLKELDVKRYWKNPEKHRSSRLKGVYGISLEDYNSMYAAQDGKCAICKSEKPSFGRGGLSVDHCHKTGRVRKLLCTSCNTAIGKMKDSIDNMQRAVDYLREFSL